MSTSARRAENPPHGRPANTACLTNSGYVMSISDDKTLAGRIEGCCPGNGVNAAECRGPLGWLTRLLDILVQKFPGIISSLETRVLFFAFPHDRWRSQRAALDFIRWVLGFM